MLFFFKVRIYLKKQNLSIKGKSICIHVTNFDCLLIEGSIDVNTNTSKRHSPFPKVLNYYLVFFKNNMNYGQSVIALGTK